MVTTIARDQQKAGLIPITAHRANVDLIRSFRSKEADVLTSEKTQKLIESGAKIFTEVEVVIKRQLYFQAFLAEYVYPSLSAQSDLDMDTVTSDDLYLLE